MNSKSPFDHKEAGYSLAKISEKILICLGDQFSYSPALRQYRTVSGLIDTAVSNINILRDYLCSLAYRKLPGDLPYKYYYPGSQGIDFSTGLFAKTAGENSQHRFDIRAEKRKHAFSDSKKQIVFSHEDRVDANIWLFSASNAINEISDQARHAFHSSRAKKIQRLAAEATKAVSRLDAQISRL